MERKYIIVRLDYLCYVQWRRLISVRHISNPNCAGVVQRKRLLTGVKESTFKCATTRIKVHAKYWFESLKGRDHSEDLGVDGGQC